MQFSNSMRVNGGNPIAEAAGAQPGQPSSTGAGGTVSASLASSSTSPGSTATSTATITANDFLQLLVTELKNQDPTANVDPNEYVNQLVQVNSLQQEIQMNQTLDGGPTLTGASTGLLQQMMQMNNTLDGDLAGATSSSGSSQTTETARLHGGMSPRIALGGGQNAVSNPSTQASAETIANALAPHPQQAAPPAGEELPKLQIPASQTGAFARFAASLRANHASGRQQ